MSELSEKIYNRNLVVVGALIVQLCLGSIYAWSQFQTALKTPTYGVNGLDTLQSLLPFAVGLATFAVAMVFAGKWQDRVGPTKVATVGGVLLGGGVILASGVFLFAADATMTTLWLVLTYGIIGGAGIGLAYVCPIAALVKWFPDKKGMITGIAVAGFGAGALVFLQVEKFFIEFLGNNRIELALFVCGIIYLVGVVLGAQLLKNPPEGWKPEGWEAPAPKTSGLGKDVIWQDMIKTPQFWLLWAMFIIGATAGLMTLGILKSFVGEVNLLFAAEAATIGGVLSIFNALGRIAWGALSDRLGRTQTMVAMFALLTLAMGSFGFMTDLLMLYIVASVIGFCFGGNFALFPSTTADYFGTKNVGNNYGFVFTAYGVAGILGAVIPAVVTIEDVTGYQSAFLLTAFLALIAVGIAVIAEYINRKEE